MKRNLAAGLVLVAACAQSPAVTTTPPTTTTVPPTASTTTPSTTTSAGVAASVDLDGFLAELEMTHPEPFHGVSRPEFVTALEELKSGIADMTPAVALVETMRLTALLSSQGRDGHQFADTPRQCRRADSSFQDL